MIRAYRYALDPTPAQERGLRSHCGAVRYSYNHMLALVQATVDQRAAERTYGIPDDQLTPALGWSAYSLRKTWNQRKALCAPWWGEVSKEAFASGCAQLATALKAWGDSRSGKRKGRQVGFPRFKSRRSTMSCTFTTGTIRLESDRRHVTLPRLGAIHLHESSRRLARLIEQGRARITQATVSFRRGRWFVALLAHVETPEPRHAHPGTTVGVDLGVKDLIVAATPDGREVLRLSPPPALRETDARKRKLQRRMRRRQGPRRGASPSKRWLAAQRQVNRLDARIADVRADALHKATTALARKFETVVVEDLAVTAMMTRGGARKRGLNRGIGSAAMAMARQMLTYKTAREGGSVEVVNRWRTSSKPCSGCTAVKAKLLLSERTYRCDACGLVIDRDLNAAINLARMGTAGSGPVDGRGAERKTAAPRGVVAAGDEASTSHGSGQQDGDLLLVTAGSPDDAFAPI